MNRQETASSALVLAAALIAATAYWPALSGPFLFDDLRNLPGLGRAGGVVDWPTFALWTFGGSSGPLGRPLALASFLLNDFTWPTDPWSFKYTNLMLHLGTGLLLYWVFLELGKALPQPQQPRAKIAAAAATALWLLHPAQMATVMLVVQRMTILATAFMLLGCLSWLKARSMAPPRPLAATLAMLAGLGAFGLLALLSKEIAVLLPCYVAVIAWTLAPMPFAEARWRLAHWAILMSPPLAAIAYLALRYPQLADDFAIRSFTAWQRLITEPQVLWMYVRELLLPNLRVTLYFDDLVATPSLAASPLAILAVTTWIGLVALAVAVRARAPMVTFGILWFVVGNLLEAGPLSLELAFLHRNYLPYAGPLFALCHALLGLEPPRLGKLVLAAWIGICAAITALNAQTWGNEGLLYATWAEQRPLSARAQQDAARFSLQRGQLKRSLEYLDRAVAASPRSPALRVERYYLQCVNGRDETEPWRDIEAMLPRAEVDTATADALTLLQNEVASGGCRTIELGDIETAARGLIQSPRYAVPDWQRALWNVIAMGELKQGDVATALQSLDSAYAAYPSVETAELQASLMEAAGRPDQAVRYLERARSTPPRSLGERIYFERALRPSLGREIERLGARVRKTD